MILYYLVHVSGTDWGISGIPRVVKNLARELSQLKSVELTPVSWCSERKVLIHTEKELLDNLALFGGPSLAPHASAGEPIAAGDEAWLLAAEVPHLHSYNAKYPSVQIGELFGDARRKGLRIAVVFHDILPLTHGRFHVGAPIVKAQPMERLERELHSEVESLGFRGYAQALANADLILPVSKFSGRLLSDWLLDNGVSPGQAPPIAPVALPEEVRGVVRRMPEEAAPTRATKEFVAIGTVCARKNQLGAMIGFIEACRQRPDLEMRLHVVGTVEPECAALGALLCRQAGGRIALHGHLPDAELMALFERARATVFVSLGEGYGLPVVEGLWHGVPSLCSNNGAMAEVAADGGCLTVDPTDVFDIARGFEALAEDETLYARLLREIAQRNLRRWEDYALELVGKIQAVSIALERGLERGTLDIGEIPTDFVDFAFGRRKEPRTAAKPHIFFFRANDFNVPDEFVENRSRPLRTGSVIRYVAHEFPDVLTNVLFYGPYCRLPAGRYCLALDAELDGAFDLRITAEDGRRQIHACQIADRNERVWFDVPQSVERFELVGTKIDALKTLTLRSILLTRQNLPESAVDYDLADGRLAVDRAGHPLGVRFKIMANAMQVNEHFGLGEQNQLRTRTAIVYDSEIHPGTDPANLFYGPYVTLEPGRYSVKLLGATKGSFKLRFCVDSTNSTFLSTTVETFEDPLIFDLYERVSNFEVVGSRTYETRAMSLFAVEFDRLGPPEGA